MLKKNAKKFIILLIFCLLLCVNYKISAVAAATVDYRDSLTPTFGLYTETDGAISHGTVTFDISDAELFAERKIETHAEYTVIPTGKERVEFSVPFVARADKMPPLEVFADGRRIEGRIAYGENYFSYADKHFDFNDAMSKVYPTALERSPAGTLYTFVPTADEIKVQITLTAGQSLIYQRSNNVGYGTAGTTFDIRIGNAFSAPAYTFFVTDGQAAAVDRQNADLTSEPMSCKEYVDSYYAEFKEFYEFVGAPSVGFFYSQMNRVLDKGFAVYEFDDIFLNSYESRRFNTFNFGLDVATETVITIAAQADLQGTFGYEPPVYFLSQANVSGCPTEYAVQLTAEIPYITDSVSPMAKQENNRYAAAATTDDFYCAFSASGTPVDRFEEQERPKEEDDKTYVVIIAVLSGVAALILAVVIFYKIKSR